MTPTERLRELLDERGVEWKAPNSILRDEMTSYVANGFDIDAFELPEGEILLTGCNHDDITSPEQAIAATLGDSVATGERQSVAELERRIYDRCLVRVGQLEAENEKLRSLVRQWYPHALRRVGRDALEQWGQMDVVRELGIEV